jgi:hypothetical protein
MYLFDFFDEDDDSVYSIVKSVAEKYNIATEPCLPGKHINASIFIRDYSGNQSLLSEFPGNCSSLVLSNIQGYDIGGIDWKNGVDTSIDICKALDYGALWVSGTSSNMKEILINDYGFEVLEDKLYNPHSKNENYFLVKRFSKKDE